MSKTLIIHWYCNHVQRPWRTKQSKYGQMNWLYDLFESWKLDIFLWGCYMKPDWLTFLNPLTYLYLYRKEQKLTQSPELQQELLKTIRDGSYEIVIGHSMWTALLLNTLQSYWAPPTLQKIITIQSDLDKNVSVTNKELLNKFSNKEIVWDNYYNFWDPQLLISTVVNGKGRLGLASSNHQYIQHYYHKLWWRNRHTYSVNNADFIRQLMRV